jgi:hypothetical protein
MSRNAINDVTLAVQQLLQTAISAPATPQRVFVGRPGGPNSGLSTEPVSLFLFHIEPNQELRNTERLVPGRSTDLRQQSAIPLDLRYLITVHRQPVNGTIPNELLALGQVVAGLQATQLIGHGLVPDQEVWLTPEPYPMEELSRIWGLFPNASYTTSMVYLASPVFVDAGDFLRGAPVETRRIDSGSSAEPPDVFGDRRWRLQQGLAE